MTLSRAEPHYGVHPIVDRWHARIGKNGAMPVRKLIAHMNRVRRSTQVADRGEQRDRRSLTSAFPGKKFAIWRKKRASEAGIG